MRCLVRPTSDLSGLAGLPVQFVRGDVLDREVLAAGMAGCDWLFHLGNLYSMWEPDSRKFEQVNVAGTQAVLEVALAVGVRRVVYVSTVAVYGRPDRSPFDENARPGPRLFSQYARSKAEAERAAWNLYEQRGLPLVVLYPGIVLGAGDDKPSGQYIRDILFHRVPGTIFHNSISTYVYVGDLVEALLRAAERPETVGQKYLVGGEMLTGRALVELVSQVSGVRAPLIRFPDWMVIPVAYLLTGLANLVCRPPWWGLSVDAAWTLKHGFQFDGSKAERDLGISYSPIRDAMAEAVAYYRSIQGRMP